MSDLPMCPMCGAALVTNVCGTFACACGWREVSVMTQDLRDELLKYCDPDDVPPVGTKLR